MNNFEYSLYEYNNKREFESLVVDMNINNVLSHFITKIEMVSNELCANKEDEQKLIIDFFNKEDDQILVNIYIGYINYEESIIKKSLVHYFIFSKESIDESGESLFLSQKKDRNDQNYLRIYKKAEQFFQSNTDNNNPHQSIFHFTWLLKSLKNIEK